MTAARAPTALNSAVATARRTIDQALEAGRREATQKLAVAMALRDDHLLQALLRRAGKAAVTRPYLLRLGEDPAWISLGASRGGLLSRTLPRGASEGMLSALLAEEPQLQPRLDAAAAARMDAARRLAEVAFGDAAATTAGWREVEPWSPLLDAPAYRVAMRLAAGLEAYAQVLRVAPRPPPEALLLYWRGVELFQRASGLACRIEGREHLAAMATRFDWARMSPSWTMLRHRSLGLAVSAGRTAAAFGPEAIPSYFRRLERGRSRLQRFDALFGLTAIGLAEPTAVKAIQRDLRQLAASPHRPPDSDIDEALATLDGGARARNAGWLLRAHLGERPTPQTWRRLMLCDVLFELPDGVPAAFAGLSELAGHQALRSGPPRPWPARPSLLPKDVRTVVRRIDSDR